MGLTLAFFILLVVIVILADANRLPAALAVIYTFRYGDKAGHFLLIGLLNFLVALAITTKRSDKIARTIALGSLAVGCLATLEEASQNLFQARTASWGDLLSGYAGIIAFGLLAFWLRKRETRTGRE